MYDTLITYYDEINIKGRNKSMFENKLRDNVIDVIKYNFNHEIEFKEKNSGFLIFNILNLKISDELIFILKHIPGVSNFILASSIDYDYKNFDGSIIKTLLDSYVKKYELKNINQTYFKVDTKRHFKNIELKSHQINTIIGNMVDDKFIAKMKNPDFTITLSITRTNLYISLDHHKGVGGLPIGVSGKALCLISGGIDSPVASYMMMIRGMDVTFVHFQNRTLLKGAVENKIKDLVKQVSKFQTHFKLIVVPFDKIQSDIIMNVKPEYRMLLYRRMMIKLSNIICEKENIYSLILGDNIAQVASQTMRNLIAVYSSTDKLILTPLIGLNKNEIMRLSRDIRTYDISIKPYPDCCSLLISKNPSTNSRTYLLDQFESKLNIDDGYLNRIIADSKIIES